MNIAEILKDCPKGTKLYSPLFGECELMYIDCVSKTPYPIIIKTEHGDYSFTKEGLLYKEHINAECVLFPSKDNRDWSTFKAQKEKEHEFKPFDKVLVRDSDYNIWDIELFSYIDNSVKTFKYVCLTDSWDQCIPYEGNEHLLNTTKSLN